MYIAGLLLTYSKTEKVIVYESLLRLFDSQLEGEFSKYFLANFKMPFYQDISGKTNPPPSSSESSTAIVQQLAVKVLHESMYGVG